MDLFRTKLTSLGWTVCLRTRPIDGRALHIVKAFPDRSQASKAQAQALCDALNAAVDAR